MATAHSSRSAAGVGLSTSHLPSGSYTWDPLCNSREEPTPQCLLRARRDIMDIFAAPPAGVFIAPEENDITRIEALVVGPPETPYEGGFFYFLVKCPPEYPNQPPRVRIMTTGGGQVSLNPNFHPGGKVCLSILGTSPGPAWTPALSIESVLVSIQSIMAENPYYNHPQFRVELTADDVCRYNAIVQHETIRVAVCDAVQACLDDEAAVGSVVSSCTPPPTALREVIFETFAESYDRYEAAVKARLEMTGCPMNDPFGITRGRYDYKTLLRRLQDLNDRVKRRNEISPEKND
ncbi:ubiquitin-conjugating enzyme E2 Z [Rhipicephalus microplus]|uniref:ubiquitin-conjugating enzyme E2 Z n=1 Tax=Rhipicephalus microplus TaxID=6941 RepID=UPI003F6D65B5